jgi:hypothetical protein
VDCAIVRWNSAGKNDCDASLFLSRVYAVIDPDLKERYRLPPIQQRTLNGWGTQVSVFMGRNNRGLSHFVSLHSWFFGVMVKGGFFSQKRRPFTC